MSLHVLGGRSRASECVGERGGGLEKRKVTEDKVCEGM